jgi:alkylhydroperoxidase family enzyme
VSIGFVAAAEESDEVRRLFDQDIADLGYVMNTSRLWAYQPSAVDDLFALMKTATSLGVLTFRQRGILVAACASSLGDSYCSLAWGGKLAGAADPETAASVLLGGDEHLDAAERALAAWARQVARDPNATSAADVQTLRDAGFDDRRIFAITLFLALRIAFSTVNDALGVPPDAQLRETAPRPVLDAVRWGRAIADEGIATG